MKNYSRQLSPPSRKLAKFQSDLSFWHKTKFSVVASRPSQVIRKLEAEQALNEISSCSTDTLHQEKKELATRAMEENVKPEKLENVTLNDLFKIATKYGA